ncbi:Hypothetical protein I596_3748 [Dokdonella koreensis DS-123]|uniref:Uncharacterized protein n=1 Tax=Dokdonella koreensis DS-123 TaxID=1300342 RepID=A0A160DZ07_9GAMM|nr:Hypothetical protein I596_3748 [Dokdonella koreensis DS-123]
MRTFRNRRSTVTVAIAPSTGIAVDRYRRRSQFGRRGIPGSGAGPRNEPFIRIARCPRPRPSRA